MRLAPSLRLPAIALAAALAASPLPSAAEELVPVPWEALRGKIETQALHAIGPNGLEVAVDGSISLALPIQAQALELELQTDGPVVLTYASQSPGRTLRAFGPPWRHLTVPRERATVFLDLRITEGWNTGARPVIGLSGAGIVVIHRIRALPVLRDQAATDAAVDEALRWAPESPGHTTINVLTPAFWSATRGTWLSDVVALAAAVAFAVALGVSWQRRRRLGLGRALAAGCLVAAGLWNVHLLVRLLPAFHLRPTLDVEARIRDHYDIAPDVGALAALARETLRPDERVGVIGAKGSWFAPQTICFNLAPRPCVVMTAGVSEPEHAGISRVGRLRDSELDAVITFRAGPLPDGFVRVAGFGNGLVIARRHP